MNIYCQGTPEKVQCTNLATHHAGWLDKNLCPECLHYYAEDASPDEQASIEDLRPEPCFMPANGEVDLLGAIFGNHEHPIEPGFPRPFIAPKVQEKCFEYPEFTNQATQLARETRYTYTPPKPFRLGGLLVWEGEGMITSLTVANIEQVIGGIPLQYFEAPFPIEHAQECIKQGMLEQCLPDHFKGLYFPTCNPDCGTIITITDGSFKHLMFWGIELV